MKRFLSFVLALIVVVCCSGCGLSTFSSSENIHDSTFEPGAQLSVQGGGTVKFLKVHTARRLYPSLHFGSYLECSSEEMCYIDIVFQLKSTKKALHSAELGGVSAIGNVSNIEYSGGICAVECNDNRDLLTNAQIEAGDTAVVHMAVEVPADTTDDEFEITVSVLSSTYSFLYEFGDKTDNMEYINVGQSISNQNFKAKLNNVYYSHELYRDAPAVCDSDDDYVYLISELEVTNKSLSDADFRKVVSVSAVYGNEILDARYLLKDEEADNHYLSDGKIESLDTATILAVIDLPIDYSKQDVKLEFAIDQNEFTHTMEGDSSIAYEREQEIQKQEAAEEAQRRARAEAARLAEEMDRQSDEDDDREESQQEESSKSDKAEHSGSQTGQQSAESTESEQSEDVQAEGSPE